MDHNFTKERDFRMFASEYSGNYTALFCSEEVPQIDHWVGKTGILLPYDYPDPQIVRNILNYALSLEVLKPATGPALFLLKN